jgi:putative phosphoribosyl transferase
MRQVFQRGVFIPAQGRLLEGTLAMPEGASGIVLGSLHPHVAGALQQKGLATLRLALLTPQEELLEHAGQAPRPDIDLLASRMLAARDWLLADRELHSLPLGYFGSTTGAAAALVAAARQPQGLTALVAHSGRVELVLDVLPLVRTPTQLIVAGDDVDDLLLNQKALEALRSPEKALRLVPHASHDFEEPGALDDVAWLAGDWFARYFHAATQMKYGWADELGRWV